MTRSPSPAARRARPAPLPPRVASAGVAATARAWLRTLPSLAALALLVGLHSPAPALAQSVRGDLVGVGVFEPRQEPGHVLRFYEEPGWETLPDQHAPVDSVVLARGTYHLEIANVEDVAQWFWPELRKLDYQLLALRALTVTRHWVEVVVNRETGRRLWLPRESGELVDWPTWLLGTFDVYRLDPTANPLRAEPGGRGGRVEWAGEESLTPVAVQGDWMAVELGGPTAPTGRIGWIRWRMRDRLLVGYHALS